MTAEPRPVEEIVPRDVEAIAALVRRVQSLPTTAAELLAREFVEARLAAADRENAELRGEVERLREWRGSQCEVLSQRVDEARAQLAAAQAQLAEARDERDRVGEWINHYKAEQEAIIARYMARLEAVRATMRQVADELRDLGETWLFDGDTDRPLNPGYDLAFNLADRLDVRSAAALSAAPQPEPEVARGYAPAGVPSCRCVLLVGPISQHQCQHEGDATMDGGPDFGKRCGTRIDERLCALEHHHGGDHVWLLPARQSPDTAGVRYATDDDVQALTDRNANRWSEALDILAHPVNEPPASDEPARKMTTASEIREQDAWIRGERDEPARTPDLMAALRVSVEAAKKRRIAPKDES